MSSPPLTTQVAEDVAHPPTPAQVQSAYQVAIDLRQCPYSTSQARDAETRAINMIESYLEHPDAATFDAEYALQLKQSCLPILRQDREKEAVRILEEALVNWLQMPDSLEASIRLINLIERELAYLGITDHGMAARAILEQTYEIFVNANFTTDLCTSWFGYKKGRDVPT